MRIFSSRHFSSLYLQMLKDYLSLSLPIVSSRLGPVRDIGPAVFEMAEDGNRLSILKKRKFNPFFALAEASWVLAGRRDVHALETFISDMSKYSDDGVTLHGAYGFRLRKKYQRDQLERAVDLLRVDTASRRAVVTLWDIDDLGSTSKDVPCNVIFFVKVRSGKVDLTVCNRSNDLYLGVPYDVFTFSVIQRYLAGKLGLPVGSQTHFTDSLHVYPSNEKDIQTIVDANREEQVHLLMGTLPCLDLDSYSQADHLWLIESPTELVSEENNALRLRNSFVNWLAGRRKEALANLPVADGGYAAALWYMEIKGMNRNLFPEWILKLETLNGG